VAAGQRWAVRPFQPGDEPRIVDLHNSVFPRPTTVEAYHWKLLASPCRPAVPWIWVAHAGDRIIGHYAGTPMRFLLRGQERTALHGCDVMTAADFRRQGVLTALGRAAHRAWADGGVALVTGLHYGGWGSRRHELGWREQFPAIWLWRPLRPGAIARRRFHTSAAVARALDAVAAPRDRRHDGELEIVSIGCVTDELDALWNDAGPQYEALVRRDAAWLAYRYQVAPHREYRLLAARRAGRLAGFLACRTVATGAAVHGFICDIFAGAADLQARTVLLRAAIQVLYAEGAVDIRVLVPRRHPAMRALRGAGFVRRGGAYDVAIVPLASDLPLDVLADDRRWLTMGGDFDVV
jgi:hypothetical protein